MSPVKSEPWPKETRDRWFLALLAASVIAVGYLFSPFLYVLLFAAVFVVVTWPLFRRILHAVGAERRGLAAILTTLLLFVVVFGPLALLVYLFVREAVSLTQTGIVWVQQGGLEVLLADLQDFESTQVYGWLAPYLPADFDLLDAVVEPLQQGALAVLNGIGSALPDIVGTTLGFGIDAVIFVFAVLSLYMEGPAVLRALMHLSPMEDDYERRLFYVFTEFANNMVVGSLATAVIQGIVASIGYAIAGVERLAFVGILTGVFSFVPMIGTALIWVPVALYVGAVESPGWGLFVAFWSLAFTGTVDNIVKPLFLRGSSNIHPLLIFLAVFGGLAWFGIPGVLIGPVIVAGFLAMYTIYRRDFLGLPVDEAPDSARVPMPNRIWRWIQGPPEQAPRDGDSDDASDDHHPGDEPPTR